MNSVNVFAPFWNTVDSYSIVANGLSDGIEKACGVTVNRYGEGTPRAGERLHNLSFGGFLLAYPTNFKHYGKLASMGVRVALTMFESTKLPSGWVDALNTMDAVIVPSRWNVELFKNEGVTVPVHCVPLGISETYLTVKRYPHKNRPYRFVVIADRVGRKRWDKVMDAFYLAFGKNMDVELILKSRAPLGFTLTNTNIKIVSGEYTDKQMARLYANCDCHVFASSGEGFGLPPREFAATGGISITTDWSGTSDDLPMWGLGIRSKGLVPAWKGEEGLEGIGEWADVDVEHLAELMRMVFVNRDHFAKVAKLNQQWVRQNYRWETFASRCYQIYQEAGHASHRDAKAAV